MIHFNSDSQGSDSALEIEIEGRIRIRFGGLEWSDLVHRERAGRRASEIRLGEGTEGVGEVGSDLQTLSGNSSSPFLSSAILTTTGSDVVEVDGDPKQALGDDDPEACDLLPEGCEFPSE